MIAETSRLLIRQLTLDDAEFVLRLTTEPTVIAGIGDKGVRNLEDAKRFLRDGNWTNQKRAGHAQFLVELKAENRPIGVCGILYREHLDVSDVGFAFLSAYRGKGFALEAARAMLDYGQRVLGLSSIVGLVSTDNPASCRVLEKLGLRYQRLVKMSDSDDGTALYGSEP